jgi:predicted nuclease of predicted toxin-antitoxin system
MNLYLDDNTCKAVLVAMLRKAGHTIVIPADVGCAGVSDARHFLHAINTGMVVLTKDHEDFLELHDVVQAVHGQHPGIIAIRSDNDAKRDMKDRDIVRALGNLERAGVAIHNGYEVLNHWR